jgi:hypothetical protein
MKVVAKLIHDAGVHRHDDSAHAAIRAQVKEHS